MTESDTAERPEVPFIPGNFQYDLVLNSSFAFFDHTGLGVVEVGLSVGKGTPVVFYDGEEGLKVGARLFAATDDNSRSKVLGEFRAESPVFRADKAALHTFSLVIQLPHDKQGPFVLEIDLVKELHFWFSDLGHPALQVPIRQTYVATQSAALQPHTLAQAKRTEAQRFQREERYEAIIFTLLNQLNSR